MVEEKNDDKDVVEDHRGSFGDGVSMDRGRREIGYPIWRPGGWPNQEEKADLMETIRNTHARPRRR